MQEIETLRLAHDDDNPAFWAVADNAPTPNGNTGIVLRLGGTGGIVKSAGRGSNDIAVTAQAIYRSITSRGFFVAHGALDAQRTLFVGNAYVQGLYFDPLLNGLGIGATRGFEIRVRRAGARITSGSTASSGGRQQQRSRHAPCGGRDA